MKLNYEAGKIPTKFELLVGGLAYNVPDNKMYTRLIDDTIILVSSGGGGEGGLITQNQNVLTEDFALADGISGVVTDGFTIQDGVSFTIPDGSVLSVV